MRIGAHPATPVVRSVMASSSSAREVRRSGPLSTSERSPDGVPSPTALVAYRAEASQRSPVSVGCRTSTSWNKTLPVGSSKEVSSKESAHTLGAKATTPSELFARSCVLRALASSGVSRSRRVSASRAQRLGGQRK